MCVNPKCIYCTCILGNKKLYIWILYGSRNKSRKLCIEDCNTNVTVHWWVEKWPHNIFVWTLVHMRNKYSQNRKIDKSYNCSMIGRLMGLMCTLVI